MLAAVAPIARATQTDRQKQQALQYFENGKLFIAQRAYADALISFQRALPLLITTVGETHQYVGATYGQMGMIYERQGDHLLALENYGIAVSILVKTLGGRHPIVGTIYGNMALILDEQGDGERALEYYERALTVKREALGSRNPVVATTYGNMAAICYRRGDYARAIEYYSKELSIFRDTLGERHLDVGTTYGNMALAYMDQGDFARAAQCFEIALPIKCDVLGVRHMDVATMYGFIAELYTLLGDNAHALECYGNSLTIYLSGLGERHPNVGTTYGNMALVYEKLGDYTKALEFSGKALAIKIEALGSRHQDVATIYNNMASVYVAQCRYNLALECYDSALPIFLTTRGSHHRDVAKILNNMAWAKCCEGETAASLPLFYQAFDAITTGACKWDGRGGTLQALPEVPHWLFSLSCAEASDTSRLPFERLNAALKTAVAALDVLSRLRSTLSKESRQFFEEKYRELPIWVIHLQHELEKLGVPADETTTLRAAEMASSVSFMEMMAEARVQTAGAVPDTLAIEELNLIARIKCLDDHSSDTRLLPERAAIEDTWTAFVDRLHREQPRYAALKYPRPATFEQTRAALAPDEVALEYVLGKYGAFLIAVSKDSFAFHALGSEADVKAIIIAAQAVASTPPSMRTVTRGARRVDTVVRTTAEPLAELHELLIGPVRDLVRGKRLIVVPSGDLEAISFEALRTPRGKFLVEEHSVEYAPSLAILALTRQWARENPVESRRLLALGDPVYDRADSRATLRAASYSDTMRASLERLPGTETEVRAIEALFPSSERKILMQTQATEENIERENWRDFGYLHFACHGALEAGPGRQPALVLSQVGNNEPYDGFLTLSEVISRPHRARLSVLSACNSGRSGATQSRTGVSSLARAFLLTGSDAVIVSLWPVDDEATARLMTLLYKGMREDNLRPGEALRRAQTSLRADPQHPEWAQPAFWAPFICVGE